MFDFLPSLFGVADHAQLALRTSGNWLPSPAWFVAGAVGLSIGAAIAVFLLKSVSLAIKLGLAAGLFVFLSAVGFGYEAKGENNIIPQLNVANAKLADQEIKSAVFKKEADDLRAKLAAKNKAVKAALAQAAKSFQEGLDAQSPIVSSTAIPGAAGVPVNKLIANTNDQAVGAGTGSEAKAAASIGADYTVRDWQVWSGKVITQYGEVAAQVNGLQDYVNGLAEASKKAEVPPDTR